MDVNSCRAVSEPYLTTPAAAARNQLHATAAVGFKGVAAIPDGLRAPGTRNHRHRHCERKVMKSFACGRMLVLGCGPGVERETDGRNTKGN